MSREIRRPGSQAAPFNTEVRSCCRLLTVASAVFPFDKLECPERHLCKRTGNSAPHDTRQWPQICLVRWKCTSLAGTSSLLCIYFNSQFKRIQFRAKLPFHVPVNKFHAIAEPVFAAPVNVSRSLQVAHARFSILAHALLARGSRYSWFRLESAPSPRVESCI